MRFITCTCLLLLRSSHFAKAFPGNEAEVTQTDPTIVDGGIAATYPAHDNVDVAHHKSRRNTRGYDDDFDDDDGISFDDDDNNNFFHDDNFDDDDSFGDDDFHIDDYFDDSFDDDWF